MRRAAVALIMVLSAAGCGSSPTSGGAVEETAGRGGGNSAPVCATPEEGCPCAEPGSRAACGNVEHRFGDYVTCSIGQRVCLASGRWSACTGDDVRTTRVGTDGSGLGTRGLGGSSRCTDNPCDPSCNAFTDSADGGIAPGADSGLELVDGGLAIQGTISSGALPCTALGIDPPVQTLTVTQFAPPAPTQLSFRARLLPDGCYPGDVPALWTVDRSDVATIDAAGKLTLVTPIAGPIAVTASVGGLAPATATARVVVQVLDTSAAPPGYATAFAGAPVGADTLTVLYPYAGTVFPLGLLPPIPQWSSGNAANAVKVTLRFVDAGTTWFEWSAIAPENQPLRLNPGSTPAIALAAGMRFPSLPAAVWSAFEQSAKGHDADIVLQRHRGAPSQLRAEVPTTVHFATGQLKGTAFYQSYGTNLVENYGNTYAGQTIGANRRFGAATLAIRPGAPVPTVAAGYTSADASGCRVCHSAAADGSTLVTNRFVPSDTTSNVFKITPSAITETLIPNNNDGRMSWPAVYPNGSFSFINTGVPRTTAAFPGGLQGGDNGAVAQSGLYALPTGNAVAGVSGIPASLKAATPIFSPDGRHVAFNHYGGAVAGVVGDKRSLASLDFDPGTKTFSSFRRLVTQPNTPCSAFHPSDPCTNVWPTYLPASEGVVFEKEIFNNGRVSGANHADFGGTRSGCDGSGTCADDGTKAELWWTSTDATPAATRLDRANGRDASGALAIPTNAATGHTASVEPFLNYEPTVNPQPIGGYYWVMFTSRRLFGNVATMNPWWSDPRYKPIGGDNGPTPKKLWVAAIRANPTEGTDPSFPAFYLPGQEYLAGNSRGFWVLDACKQPSATRSPANECETNLDCCGAPVTATCSLQVPIQNPPKRHCIPVSASACVADSGACSVDSECCNFAAGVRCASGTCTAPPRLTVYDEGTFERDFEAACPAGTRVVWQLFQWQATLPMGTAIDFSAVTADTAGALATASPKVAVATALPPSTTTWTSGATTVDQALHAAGTQSKPWLRVTMHLRASADRLRTPILSDWRQQYDCPPTE